MSVIHFIIASIALFIPTLTLTPAEVENGRVAGFTGGSFSSHIGDYLIGTYCFCAVSNIIPTQYSEANYMQFEYYNFHSNTTFILNHLCLAYQASEITCLAPRTGNGIDYHNGIDVGRFCRTWYNAIEETDMQLQDTLCYDSARKDDLWRQYRIPGQDFVSFNKQKRRLDTLGRQGPVLRSREVAEERCMGMCEEHAGMPILKGNERAESHVITWEDMDDMCSFCK